MLIISLLLSWFIAAGHSLFRAPEAIVWVPWTFIFPLILVAPRFLYRTSKWLQRRVRREWVGHMESVGLLAVAINAPGVLFFHVLYPRFQYDRYLHIAGAFDMVWWFALVLLPFGFAIHRKRLLKTVGITLAVLVFAWEGWQWSQDRLFGSRTFFDFAQPIVRDFSEDIFFGLLGTGVGLWHLNLMYPAFRKIRRT